jgi:hypothetical protein
MSSHSRPKQPSKLTPSSKNDIKQPAHPPRRNPSTEQLLKKQEAEIEHLRGGVEKLRRNNLAGKALLLSKDAEIALLNEEIARLQLLDQIHRFGAGGEDKEGGCHECRKWREGLLGAEKGGVESRD